MRRIFINHPITDTFSLSAEDTHHAMTVLRHELGDILEVADSTGAVFACGIAAWDGSVAQMKMQEQIAAPRRQDGKIIVAAAILKNDKFDWLVQKASELGADTVIPVQMEHCVVKLSENRRHDRVVRWQRIALEGAKQCGRRDVPVVGSVLTLQELVRQYGAASFVVPYEKEVLPFKTICNLVKTGDVVICIGPEGGFSPSEISLLHTAPHCYTVSLGPRILRAETAALTAVSIIMYERGFT